LQLDIDLIGKIEGLIEKNLEKIECKVTELLSLMKKVSLLENMRLATDLETEIFWSL
jgi:hypothetical protein